jgi:hypothetical protein
MNFKFVFIEGEIFGALPEVLIIDSLGLRCGQTHLNVGFYDGCQLRLVSIFSVPVLGENIKHLIPQTFFNLLVAPAHKNFHCGDTD